MCPQNCSYSLELASKFRAKVPSKFHSVRSLCQASALFPIIDQAFFLSHPKQKKKKKNTNHFFITKLGTDHLQLAFNLLPFLAPIVSLTLRDMTLCLDDWGVIRCPFLFLVLHIGYLTLLPSEIRMVGLGYSYDEDQYINL